MWVSLSNIVVGQFIKYLGHGGRTTMGKRVAFDEWCDPVCYDSIESLRDAGQGVAVLGKCAKVAGERDDCEDKEESVVHCCRVLIRRFGARTRRLSPGGSRKAEQARG